MVLAMTARLSCTWCSLSDSGDAAVSARVAMAHILPMLRHCTSMRSAVGLGGLAPAVLRCECNGQLDGSRFCKFEKASRLATTARSRTECIRQPTRVCIKLTTCIGHDSLMPARATPDLAVLPGDKVQSRTIRHQKRGDLGGGGRR